MGCSLVVAAASFRVVDSCCFDGALDFMTTHEEAAVDFVRPCCRIFQSIR